MKSVKLPLCATAITLCGSAVAQQPKQPNVLMIVVDDLGVVDLSLTGSKLYETDCIDQLASESIHFTEAYTAYPRSVPSRYALMTGRHCARQPINPKTAVFSDNRSVTAEDYTIANTFQDAGYQTFIIGKWHLNDKNTTPLTCGFDQAIISGKAGATFSHFAPFNDPAAKDPHKVLFGCEDAQDGEYLADYMSRKTNDYIRTASKEERPFFAVCSFYAVHTPLQGEADKVEYYKKKVNKMGLKPDELREAEGGWEKTQQDNPVYAAMIESVDEGVGEMIKTLKECGIYDNTIVVLISDHGGLSNRGNGYKRELATINAPYRAGKGHLYEGGIRIPMMLRAPNQKRACEVKTPVVSYDVLPTLADLCNIKVDPKAELDGVSLKPIITKGRQSELSDRDLFWHKAAEKSTGTGDYRSSSIRSGDYKLLDFYEQGRIELYNLKSDPSERENLVDSHPAIVKEMMNKLNKWRKETGVIYSRGKS